MLLCGCKPYMMGRIARNNLCIRCRSADPTRVKIKLHLILLKQNYQNNTHSSASTVLWVIVETAFTSDHKNDNPREAFVSSLLLLFKNDLAKLTEVHILSLSIDEVLGVPEANLDYTYSRSFIYADLQSVINRKIWEIAKVLSSFHRVHDIASGRILMERYSNT